MMNWYLAALKKYGDFNGRARRKEYWMFFLFNIIFSVGAGILDHVFGTAKSLGEYGLFGGLYMLAVLLPGIAVGVRRLHDVGKSGWMMFVALIPIVGVIWLIILFVTDGDPGMNEYGSNPKEMS